MEAKNLIIKVFGNPNQSICSVVSHFQENFKTGIPNIDNIKTQINENASFNIIRVENNVTNEVLFELKDNEALQLHKLSIALKEILNINVIKP